MIYQEIELMKANRDSNGNTRYIVHFLYLLSDKEQKEIHDRYRENHHGSCLGVVTAQYMEALNKSRAIGGKKYRGNDFGGGIIFQSNNVTELRKEILDLRGE